MYSRGIWFGESKGLYYIYVEVRLFKKVVKKKKKGFVTVVVIFVSFILIYSYTLCINQRSEYIYFFNIK